MLPQLKGKSKTLIGILVGIRERDMEVEEVGRN